MGVDLFSMVFGLGFVLSFGYWCTNFLVVQRAMAARNMTAARRTPLIAAVPKMIFPVLVILPACWPWAWPALNKGDYQLTAQADRRGAHCQGRGGRTAAAKYAPTLAAFEKEKDLEKSSLRLPPP